jgi:uncharacterized protein YjiS (DUF1127 family)
MTTITQVTAAPFGAITTYRAIHAIETALDSLIAWKMNRKTYMKLNALDTRTLEDIGLSRTDVDTMKIAFFH